MFGKGGSSSDEVDFEIFRELESGNPIAIASIQSEFSPFKKDPSAKVYKMAKELNYPIKIETVGTNVASWPAVPNSPSTDIQFTFRYNYPGSYPSQMLDLGPSQFASLASEIQLNEVVAMKY